MTTPLNPEFERLFLRFNQVNKQLIDRGMTISHIDPRIRLILDIVEDAVVFAESTVQLLNYIDKPTEHEAGYDTEEDKRDKARLQSIRRAVSDNVAAFTQIPVVVDTPKRRFREPDMDAAPVRKRTKQTSREVDDISQSLATLTV